VSNLTIAQKLIEVLSSEELGPLVSILDEDITLDIRFSLNGPQTVKGRSSVIGMIADMRRSMTFFSLSIYEAHECPARNVVILCVTAFAKLANGRGYYDNRSFMILVFRDDRIVLWREFGNPDEVALLQSRLG
jgi:hypothetical protein